MKTIPSSTALLTILALTAAAAPTADATEDIAAREEVECQVCHATVEETPETLTDQGLYYGQMQTLDGSDQVLERFERCTYCHVEEAGDPNLTPEGYRFRWMMEDMVGLRAWLEENHPQPAEEEPAEDD